MIAIKTEGLTKVFRGKKGKKVEALTDLSLEVAAGEIFGFLGPNGAGKSTTIKTLLGLIRPTSGRGELMGIDIGQPRCRRHVGYLPENPAFYDELHAEEYLAFVGGQFGMKGSFLAERSAAVLKQLDLWEARRRPVRSYSKGMVQRLGLAQVLLHDPDVYILDEPMSGLDPVGRALVKEIILDLKKRGKCVFFSTHITADVETVCDRVGIIARGRLKKVEEVRTILVEGLAGYRVRVHRRSEGGIETLDRDVRPEDLAGVLAECEAEGDKVALVEPQRKNLEKFFLDLVKSG